jgi:Fur family ferric uptake transcriptional regulator
METAIFKEFLRKKRLKFTNERRTILTEVFARHGHFDPEELLTGMRKKNIRVSRASIYRTLPLLLECGLIEQVGRNDKHAHYEHIFGHGHHDHLICLNCGAVLEVFSPKLEAIQEDLCRKAGFRGMKHTLEIKGHCSSCCRKD